MSLTMEQIARALSRHDFDAALPYLAEDVSWTLVGGEDLVGKDAVSAECALTADYLSGVTTDFRRFKSVVGESSVVVDSLADYTDPDGSTSTVASCDIYDFDNGMLSHITSYNIELTGD